MQEPKKQKPDKINGIETWKIEQAIKIGVARRNYFRLVEEKVMRKVNR